MNEPFITTDDVQREMKKLVCIEYAETMRLARRLENYFDEKYRSELSEYDWHNVRVKIKPNLLCAKTVTLNRIFRLVNDSPERALRLTVGYIPKTSKERAAQYRQRTDGNFIYIMSKL